MNPRKLRLLNALLQNESVTVKDLRGIVGALNPAQIVLVLRSQGWIIHTGYSVVLDRDGQLCRAGFYWLDDQEKEKVRAYLEERSKAVGTAKLKNDAERSNSQTSEKKNNTGGEK